MPLEKTFDPFRVLNAEERERHFDAYRAHLRKTDGEMNLGSEKLLTREPRMRELETSGAVWRGPIDKAGFTRCIAGSRNESLDARTEWILAAARANEGERYGVSIEIERFHERGGRFPGVPCQETMLYVMLQEAYHCRILVEMCRACGVDFNPQTPGWASRALLVLIGSLPGWMRWIPVMAGELVGCAVFRILHANTALFREQPEVEAHLAALMHQIWIDEVLHAAYLRALLARPALWVVRALLPIVAWSVLREVPQLRNLGCTPARIVRLVLDGLRIPPGIDWLDADETGFEISPHEARA